MPTERTPNSSRAFRRLWLSTKGHPLRRHHDEGPFTIDVGEGKLREILDTGELEMADVERAVREAIGTSLPSRSTPMHLGPSPLAERKLGKPQPSSSLSHS